MTLVHNVLLMMYPLSVNFILYVIVELYFILLFFVIADCYLINILVSTAYYFVMDIIKTQIKKELGVINAFTYIYISLRIHT